MKVDICSIMYNEELLLPIWIESWLLVPFVNKIYLVDANSTDKSVEIAKGYDRVQVMVVPWRNNFSKQRNVALKLSKGDIRWVFQPDIDELPCGNFKFASFGDYEYSSLDTRVTSSKQINQVVIPYVKFYNWNTLWFFKESVPAYKDGQVILAANKSTTTMFDKEHLCGYSKPLHEMPMLSGAALRFVHGGFSGPAARTELASLKNHFFIGHYDQAKHFYQAKKNNTTVEYEMGLKRTRYRLISDATYEGQTYTKEWAEKVLRENDVKEIEKLGAAQLRSFKNEHEILENYDAFDLNNEVVKKGICR